MTLIAYIFSFLLLVIPLFGNISNSLRNSLLYESSGRYLWSVWDYQTNPYIYFLNQNNSLSFQFTNNTFFSLGSSFLIWEQPIFLGIQFRNPSSSSTEYDPFPPGITENVSISQPDIRFIIGTLPFKKLNVLKNFGIGFHFRYKRNFRRQDPKPLPFTSDRELIGSGESSLSNDRDNYSVTSYGIEFGQFSGGVDVGDNEKATSLAIPISYSIGIGYHEYGLRIEEFYKDDNSPAGQNNAPFVELVGGNQGFQELFPDQRYFGPKKREVTIHFLSWYVLNSFSNIGISGNAFLQPKLTGRDNTFNTFEIFPKKQTSEVAVTSYRTDIEVFYDLDLSVSFKKLKLGVLRLSPGIKAFYHKERAEFDDVLGNGFVDSESYFGNIGIAFKFYIFLDPNRRLKLVSAWHPRFNFGDRFTQRIENFNLPSLQDKGGKFLYKNERGNFTDDGTLLNSARLGLEYTPIENLFLQLGLSSEGNDGFFDLSNLSLGIEYIF